MATGQETQSMLDPNPEAQAIDQAAQDQAAQAAQLQADQAAAEGGNAQAILAGDATPTEGSMLQTEGGPTWAPEDPTVSQQVEKPEVKAAGEYNDPNATVMGQLEKYLNADNPILKLAEAKARDQAQAGGMLGTSMAAGAARRAVFEQAGDWATTDTQGFQTLLGQQQQAEYSLGQTGYEGDITSKLQEEQGEITLGIQKDQQSFDKELTIYQNSQENQRHADQIAADMGMNKEQVDAQLKINADKIAADLSINDAQLANAMSIDMMKIDSSNQQAYVDAMKDLTYGYNDNVAAIMSLPDDQMSPAVKQQMIKELKEEFQGQSAMFASVWGAGIEVDGVMVGGGGSNADTSNPNDSSSPGAGADPVNNPPAAGAGAAGDSYETWQYNEFVKSFATPDDFFAAAGDSVSGLQQNALKSEYEEYVKNQQYKIDSMTYDPSGTGSGEWDSYYKEKYAPKSFGEWATTGKAEGAGNTLWGVAKGEISPAEPSPYDRIVRGDESGGDWI